MFIIFKIKQRLTIDTHIFKLFEIRIKIHMKIVLNDTYIQL